MLNSTNIIKQAELVRNLEIELNNATENYDYHYNNYWCVDKLEKILLNDEGTFDYFLEQTASCILSDNNLDCDVDKMVEVLKSDVDCRKHHNGQFTKFINENILEKSKSNLPKIEKLYMLMIEWSDAYKRIVVEYKTELNHLTELIGEHNRLVEDTHISVQ